MTRVAKKGALHLVDWGPLSYKAFHLLMGMDTKHKYHADMLWGMVLMSWVCLGRDQHHYCFVIQAQWNV